MKRSSLINKLFDIFEVYLPAIIFAALISFVATQVFARYVLNYPLPKLYELSIYSYVWVIYLGAALARRHRKHIRFDILYNAFSHRIRKYIDVFFDSMVNLIFIYILIPSIQYTIENYSVKASAVRVPLTYLQIVFILFLALIIAHNSISIYKALK